MTLPADVALRREQPADHSAVAEVVEAAFADPAHARLVADLRNEPSYRPSRALVAVAGDRVVGHVLVTDSVVVDDGTVGRVATLSPLAVAPDRQGEGIGAALVAAVLAACDAEGEPAVVLEGSPDYYGRLGFEPAAPHGLVLPLPDWAPPEAAQLHRLTAWTGTPGGTVTYAAPFARLEGMSPGRRGVDPTVPDFDLTPATRDLAALVAAVPDDALTGPTPCPAMTVGALLDHIAGLSLAFTAAATKEPLPGGPQGPSADAADLVADWRTAIPARLEALAAAWTAPEAWEGTTMAGPIEMPAPVAALVTLDEVVIHGWDLARATGQDLAPDPGLLAAVEGFVSGFSGPDDEGDGGLFGPAVPVPADAPLLDRVLGLTGRDPGWTPA